MKMIRYLTGLTVFMMITLAVMAQTPTGFKYQTVIRNADGQAFAEKTIQLRITLQNEDKSKKFYQESHSVTTNDFGLVNLVIGEGDDADGVFANIPWSQEPIFLQVEAREGTTGSYTNQGTQPMMAVPYALHATNIRTVDGSKNPNPSGKEDEPLFLVRNKQGEVVFAVYNNGVEVYIEEGEGKSRKAGFAIGGLSRSKGIELEPENDPAFFKISPYSAEIRMLEDEDGKSRKAGFAIGGLSRSKDQEEIEFMQVNPYNTRININDEDAKSRKAGFAIGGLSRSKDIPTYYMQVTDTTTSVSNIFAAKEHVVTSGRIVEHIREKVYDPDGNEYKVVKIGNQIWMAENLKTTSYWDYGTTSKINTPDYYLPNDSPFGAYYRNDAITYLSDPDSLCPKGYRIPSPEDGHQLLAYAKSQLNETTCPSCTSAFNMLAKRYEVQDDKVLDWNERDLKDYYGFGALPGGFLIEFDEDDDGNPILEPSEEDQYRTAHFWLFDRQNTQVFQELYLSAKNPNIDPDNNVNEGYSAVEITVSGDDYNYYNIRCMRDAK